MIAWLLALGGDPLPPMRARTVFVAALLVGLAVGLAAWRVGPFARTSADDGVGALLGAFSRPLPPFGGDDLLLRREWHWEPRPNAAGWIVTTSHGVPAELARAPFQWDGGLDARLLRERRETWFWRRCDIVAVPWGEVEPALQQHLVGLDDMPYDEVVRERERERRFAAYFPTGSMKGQKSEVGLLMPTLLAVV